jgi:outer membrane lipase/esterase
VKMRKYNFAAALFLAVFLAGCGGGGSSGGSQAPKVGFTSQVSFGDSLSDVGSYAVSGVAAAGGGQFTVNITGAKNNWTQLMAAQTGQQASSCAAVTGGYGSPTQTHSGCYAYGQGGARVTSDVGIGNTDAGYLPSGAYTGAMTLSVTRQIAAHLAAVGGSFSGNEVVYVLAGANDIFVEAQAVYPAYVAACMGSGIPTIPACSSGGLSATAAQAAAFQQAMSDVTGVADLLENQITTNITGKGAKYVVVVNVPDIANTPSAVMAGTSAQQLFGAMVTTFNAELKTKLASNTNALLVDAYTVNHDEVVNPAAYGLTNITGTACNVASGSWLATNFPNGSGSGSSLGCNAANPSAMTAGVTGDTHYLFADGVHPTPFGYLLLARLVSKDMLIKGWL